MQESAPIHIVHIENGPVAKVIDDSNLAPIGREKSAGEKRIENRGVVSAIGNLNAPNTKLVVALLGALAPVIIVFDQVPIIVVALRAFVIARAIEIDVALAAHDAHARTIKLVTVRAHVAPHIEASNLIIRHG